MITDGFGTWPVGREIPSSLKQVALEVFAFDALIQNPDRRPDKPNILWKGDELFIIDHEMGFSFLYEILELPNPWQMTSMRFLQNHLFYRSLKEQTINLNRFAGALESLAPDAMDIIVSNIPGEWRNQNIPIIIDHLEKILKHINEFIDEIRRVLQ